MSVGRIRPAEPKDANDLARMGKCFFEGTPLKELTTFNPESLFRLVSKDGDTATFIYEFGGKAIGSACVIVYPMLFNNDYLIAQELFWWVDEDYRRTGAGRELHSHIEEWAKSRGAKAMTMIAIENECVDRVIRLYNHYGYSPLEHAFVKEI